MAKHITGKSFAPGVTDLKAWSDEHSVTILGESLTVQDNADDTNINTIMRRAGITGVFPNPNTTRLPTYDDFTGVKDYASALNTVIAANSQFMAYPAEFRARFENDPQQFAAWALDPGSKDELYKLGMLNDRARNAYEAHLQAKAATAGAGGPPANGGVPGAPPGAPGTGGPVK